MSHLRGKQLLPGTFGLLVYLLHSHVEPVTQNKWRNAVGKEETAEPLRGEGCPRRAGCHLF